MLVELLVEELTFFAELATAVLEVLLELMLLAWSVAICVELEVAGGTV